MAWRRSAPWRVADGEGKGSWVWQPEGAGGPQSGPRGKKKVKSKDNSTLVMVTAPAVCAVVNTLMVLVLVMAIRLIMAVLELERWAVHYPALAGVARDAAPPAPPEIRLFTAGELDQMAALEQTRLAREVEAASKNERLAAQEVQWRLDRFNRAKATMEEMQNNHLVAEQNLEVARRETREADSKKLAFSVEEFKQSKIEEQRREAARQAQAAADAGRLDAAGGARAPPPGGGGGPQPAGGPGAAGGVRAPPPGAAEAGGAAAADVVMEDGANNIPWLRGRLVDFVYVESHLYEFDDPMLELLVRYSGIQLDKWQQYRLHLLRMRDAQPDDVFELGSEVGDELDQVERDQFRELKKRAGEAGLDAAAAKEYTDLLQKRLMAKSVKRARTSQAVTCDMYRTFCTVAATQMDKQ
ncbi:unnamed protein product, partial [Prorocentrum cordatum]